MPVNDLNMKYRANTGSKNILVLGYEAFAKAPFWSVKLKCYKQRDV